MAEDTSSPDERDRLIAEALAHAVARDALYRPPTEVLPSGRWRSALALVLLVLSGVLASAPPSWLQGAPRPTVTDRDRALGVRVALELQAEQIEAFRQRNQQLPMELAELSSPLPGIRFVRSDHRLYQLVAYGPDRRPVILESTRPSAEPRETATAFLARVDGS
jgi:hypothetical protein